MNQFEDLKQFVSPFYESKDIMHNLSHIERFLKIALRFAKKYSADEEVLTFAAYFHGLIYDKQELIIEHLQKSGCKRDRINLIIQVSLESQTDATLKSIEGKILHDAHLIEGGKLF